MAAAERLQIISDIHIDYRENLELLLQLPKSDYHRDTLMLAGDATDNLERLETFLAAMVKKFQRVLFVPGNHELWVKRSGHTDSLHKFTEILDLCESLGVITEPVKIGEENPVWLVPLFSWYHTGEHPERSLFLEKKSAEDKTFEMWSDFFVTQWPAHMADDICQHFLDMNTERLQPYDAPVVSMSHFLPRQELMMSTQQERDASQLSYKDLHPEFNFSHVAGSRGIEEQVRELGSRVHVYGHQHRNRCRHIEGVTYVSHCMGYPKERKAGVVAQACVRPMEIWNDQEGILI